MHPLGASVENGKKEYGFNEKKGFFMSPPREMFQLGR